MSIVRIDGFEEWSPDIISDVADVFVATQKPSVNTTGTRWGYGQYLVCSKNQWVEFRLKKTPGGTTFYSVGPTAYLGFAFKINSLSWSNSRGYRLVAYVYHTNASAGTTQMSLVVHPDGKLELRRNYASNTPDISASLPSGTSTNAISANTWYYIEVKWCIGNPSPDTSEVKVNGSTWITVPSGSNTYGQSGVSGVGTNFDSYGFGDENDSTLDDQKCYDDVYVLDPSTGSYSSYLGDCRVETLMPAAAGSTTQWSRTGAGKTDNYQCVNEAIADNDSTYVSTSGVGNRDTYLVPDLSSDPTTIFCVEHFGIARVDAGETTRKICFSLNVGGTYYDHTDQFTLTSSYLYWPSIWMSNPATSAAWSYADIGSLEAGVKLVS
jgi:hypothetical protein